LCFGLQRKSTFAPEPALGGDADTGAAQSDAEGVFKAARERERNPAEGGGRQIQNFKRFSA